MRPTARAALAACLLAAAATAAATDFYVSPRGSDRWSGTLPSPNAAHTDGPFATLGRARDAVRQRIAAGLKADVEVQLRGGLYRLAETVVFGPADAGTDKHTVTYAAYPDEKPVLSSGRPIAGWRELDSAPPGLPQAARGKVWVAAVPQARGGGWRFRTLFRDERRLPRARSPKRTTANPVARRRRSKNSKTSFRFKPGHLRNWPHLADVEIVCRPTYPWVCNILGLEAVDEARRTAATALPATYPIAGDYWVENVLEALDSPGEWVLDSREGTLTLWPTKEPPGDDIVAPQLAELIRVEGDEAKPALVRNLVFRGLTFTHGERDVWTAADRGLQHDWEMEDKANALLRFRGAEHCAVEACRFVNSGGTAIRLDLHCQHIRVVGNEIAHVGGTGILLCGYGPGTRDVNHHNVVARNHIHHCGELYWHGAAIYVTQSGHNRIAHNRIHHTPYTGIVVSGVRAPFFVRGRRPGRECTPTIRFDETGQSAEWDDVLKFLHARDNLVEDNEIFQTMLVLGDGNGIYISGTGTGNIIRRNYVHHIFGRGAQSAIRTDDYQKATLIDSNVVFACSCGGITLKHTNDLINNIVVDVAAEDYILLRRGPCTGSRILRNILTHPGRHKTFYDEGRNGAHLHDCQVDANLYFCAAAPDFGLHWLQALHKRGLDSTARYAEPGFVDWKAGDFRLKPGSPALAMGFKPIDLSQVGIDGPAASSQWGAPPPPPPPQPIHESFDATPIGRPAADAATHSEGKGDSITACPMPDGAQGRCIKFLDAPGLQHRFDPHLVYEPGFREGVVHFQCDLWLEAGTDMKLEWRTGRGRYRVGPSIRIVPGGRLSANSKPLLEVPTRQWLRLAIRCPLGQRAARRYDLTVAVRGREPRAFKAIAFDRAFDHLGWLGFISLARDKRTFYLDNLWLDAKPPENP